MAQTVDATHYTIVCDTLTKAPSGSSPRSYSGGAVPLEQTKIKGTLSGRTATPDGTNPAITVLSGSVSGLLNSTNNGCLSLLAPFTATGTITIKWKVASPIKLTNATTTITIASGNVVGGTLDVFGDGVS